MLGGGGWGVRKNLKKINGATWCILSVPKYVMINLKLINFKDKKSTATKIICVFSPIFNVSTKINTFTFYKGGPGAKAHQRPKKF